MIHANLTARRRPVSIWAGSPARRSSPELPTVRAQSPDGEPAGVEGVRRRRTCSARPGQTPPMAIRKTTGRPIAEQDDGQRRPGEWWRDHPDQLKDGARRAGTKAEALATASPRGIPMAALMAASTATRRKLVSMGSELPAGQQGEGRAGEVFVRREAGQEAGRRDEQRRTCPPQARCAEEAVPVTCSSRSG